MTSIVGWVWASSLCVTLQQIKSGEPTSSEALLYFSALGELNMITLSMYASQYLMHVLTTSITQAEQTSSSSPPGMEWLWERYQLILYCWIPSTHLLHVQLVTILTHHSGPLCHASIHYSYCSSQFVEYATVNHYIFLHPVLFSQFVQWKHNLDRDVYYMDMGENLTVCLSLIHEQLVQW